MTEYEVNRSQNYEFEESHFTLNTFIEAFVKMLLFPEPVWKIPQRKHHSKGKVQWKVAKLN